MLSDGNVSIKEQILFFRNRVHCRKFSDETLENANLDNLWIIYIRLFYHFLYVDVHVSIYLL